MKKTILFDRDGTLIVDKHYLCDPSQVELFPDVIPALQMLRDADWQFFLVTNQSGVGRGYFSLDAMHACNAALCHQLKEHNITVEGIAYCPHTPEDNCSCRKPAIGMWEQLASIYNLAPATTVMVGDKPEDMAVAVNAGLCGRILVQTGKGVDTVNKLRLPFASHDTIVSFAHPHINEPDVIIKNLRFLPEALQLLSLMETQCKK